MGLGLLSLAGLDAADWTLMSRRDGIEIYRREMPGTPLVVFKGEGPIDAPVWKIASILLDTKRAPEWADSLKESRVAKRLGPAEYEEYNHLGMPLILKEVTPSSAVIRPTMRMRLVSKPVRSKVV